MLKMALSPCNSLKNINCHERKPIPYIVLSVTGCLLPLWRCLAPFQRTCYLSGGDKSAPSPPLLLCGCSLVWQRRLFGVAACASHSLQTGKASCILSFIHGHKQHPAWHYSVLAQLMPGAFEEDLLHRRLPVATGRTGWYVWVPP